MKTVEFTLYEIFGYLIPGSVGLLAVYLIAWRILLPSFQDWSGIASNAWIVLAVVAYLVGHSLQAISNAVYQVTWNNTERQLLSDESVVPANVLATAQQSAKCALGLSDNDGISMTVLYDVMDHYVQQHGNTETRELYIYREGFYRGLSIGLFLLAIAALFHMTGEDTVAAVFGTTLALTRPSMAFVTVLSLVMAVFSVGRYRRFVKYRVKNCLFSFLALRQRGGGLQC